MKFFQGTDSIPIAVIAAFTLAVSTGCHHGGGNQGASYGTRAAPLSEPSGGGTTVAEERPGAGIGAQTSAGAAADVPEATQRGAGASALTKPNEQAYTGQGGAASTGEQPQTGASSQPAAPASTQAQAAGGPTSTNMAIPLYQESLQVGKQEVPSGSVHIRKYTTTETVNKPLDLNNQTVTVERAPASGGAAQSAAANPPSGQAFQGQDMTIQLYREEPTISKQVVPEGQVVARVQTEVQHTNVQGQIRREQVQVTKQGDVQNASISPDLTKPGATSEAMGGAGQVGSQSQGAGAGGGPITDPTTLTSASDPSSLAGRPVNLSNLKVQQVIGDHMVVVSDSSGKPLYVRTSQPVQNIKEGDTVSLSGTINRVPSTGADLGLGQEASQALEGQAIYLDAKQIQPTSQ